MEFCLILGSICVILGLFLIPFHKKVKAEKAHAFGFLILGVLILIAPFALGLSSYSDLGIPIENLMMALLFLLLLISIIFVIWFFKDGNKKKGFISLSITIALAIGLFTTIIIFSPKPQTDTIDAVVFAENAVESKLKSPSTAEFSPLEETQVKQVDNNTYIVAGWVDAQNSFGATIRSYYEVKLTINSDNKATLEYCNIR